MPLAFPPRYAILLFVVQYYERKRGVCVNKLSHHPHIDLYRHLAFAAVGGFFGGYAILSHSGIMGSAQTVNLLELLMDILRLDGGGVLVHFGALVLYVIGTMLTVILPRRWGVDMHYVSPAVTAVCAVIVAVIPREVNTVLALYPVFFAMSVQWSSFGGARGFYSSTIFSTNNTKQASLSLAEFLCDGDRVHLKKTRFYALTLLCFHIGAAISFFGVKWWGLQGSLLVLPLVAWSWMLAVCERRYERTVKAEEGA